MTPDFRAEQQHAMHSLKGDPHRKLDWWRRVSRYTILGTVLLLVVSVLANITFYRNMNDFRANSASCKSNTRNWRRALGMGVL